MNEPGYPNWSTFLFASQIQSVIWFLGIRILDQQMMIKSISFLLYCLAIYNKNQYLLSTYNAQGIVQIIYYSTAFVTSFSFTKLTHKVK